MDFIILLQNMEMKKKRKTVQIFSRKEKSFINLWDDNETKYFEYMVQKEY